MIKIAATPNCWRCAVTVISRMRKWLTGDVTWHILTSGNT